MIKDIITANESARPDSDVQQRLHADFPQCFNNEGKFDIDKFSSLLKDNVSVINEGYDLNFLGKSYAKLLSTIDTTTIIKPDLEHNSKPENVNSENIYISGDNLDALKHLLKSYAGRIKCIYIDPPYNTGTDGFVYNDNFTFSAEELESKLSINPDQATKILELTKRGSASHSAWLMFMMPRLQLAKDLLTDDGVIFISIDDNEQANLKILCDTIFGEENTLSQIIIQSNKRGQTYKQLAKTHEYLLAYAKSENSIVNELKKELSGNIMADGVSDFSERELRNRNPKYGKFNRPNLFYPIYVNPNITDKNGYCPISLERSLEYSIEVLPYNSENGESCWRWGKSKLISNISDSSFQSNAVARIKSTGLYGIYEKYRKGTYKAKTIWYEDIVITDEDDEDEIWDETGVITEQGSAELKKYDMADAFDFPKPTYLIKKAFLLGSNEDDICLDFFSGSATSGESVLSLNTLSGNRRFILVQYPENLDIKFQRAMKSDKPKIKKVIDFLDQNHYPHSLDWVGIERLKRASARIMVNYPSYSGNLGFKHYTLCEPSETTIDKLEKFSPKELFANDSILNEFGKESVLETWCVKDGYGFGAKIDTIQLGSYSAYHCGFHLYFINPSLSEEDVVALIDKYNKEGSFNPNKVVIFGYSFTFSQTEMLRKNLAVLKDSKNLPINIEIRY